MMNRVRKYALVARNWAIYRQHDFWAKSAKADLPSDQNSNFIVSIASYPKRIHLIPAVIESIARQRCLPKRLFLVLSIEDYPDKKLPDDIKKLQGRGLEILWVKNNPFAVKKLMPLYEKDLGLTICTLDDDIIYAPTVTENLVERAEKNKGSIVGCWGKSLYRRGTELSMWFRQPGPLKKDAPDESIYLLGGGGIMYPPKSLDRRFLDVTAVHKYVPGRGSDIWFYAAAKAANTRQICETSRHASRLWIPIPQNRQTQPRERPGTEELENRFQQTVDFFGIREKLISELPNEFE